MAEEFLNHKEDDFTFPPTFKEMIHVSRQLFSSGYYEGRCLVKVNAKSCGNIDLNFEGSHNSTTGMTQASLRTRYLLQEDGFSLSGTWLTSNDFVSQLYMKDFWGLTGVLVGAGCSVAPYSSYRKVTADMIYQSEYFSASAELVKDCGHSIASTGIVGRLRCPSVCPSSCKQACYHNFVAGFEMTVDPVKRRTLHSYIACGYYTNNFLLNTAIKNGALYSACIYQRLTPLFELGFDISYSRYSNKSLMDVGCQYQVDNLKTVKAKINSIKMIGLSFSYRLRPEVRISVSADIDLSTKFAYAFGAGAEFST